MNQRTSVFLVPNAEPGTECSLGNCLLNKKTINFSHGQHHLPGRESGRRAPRLPARSPEQAVEPVLPLSCNWTHAGSETVQLIRRVSANRESGQMREEIVGSEEEGEAGPGGGGTSSSSEAVKQGGGPLAE